MKKREFSRVEAERIGTTLGADWARIPLEEFRLGLAVEFERGTRESRANVTDDDPIATGRIALAHLMEFPDYYTRLTAAEMEAEEYGEGVDTLPPRLQNR